jgi:hypothetical protein
MAKQHRDFVILVKGTEEIHALVVFSHTVTTPATQETAAFDTEYLTVIYTNKVDGSAWPSKDKILQGLQVEMSVPPVSAGKFFGWKDVVSVETAIPPTTTLTPAPEVPGSDGYTHGWDKGFAGEGDPYGISEYTDQSANLDAVQGNAAAPVIGTGTGPALIGPDGKTDAERGYVWGSPEHVAALRSDPPAPESVPAEEVVQNDPEIVAAVDAANNPTSAPADPPAESPAA